MSVDSIRSAVSKGQVLRVDIRSPSAFDAYHAVGSVNVPLHLIKTKPFLKQRQVVLLNDGKSVSELTEMCGLLREQGFTQLHVLEHGIYGWRATGGEIVGDKAALRDLDRMVPEDLLVESAYTHWLALDFTDGKRKDIYKLLPQRRLT